MQTTGPVRHVAQRSESPPTAALVTVGTRQQKRDLRHPLLSGGKQTCPSFPEEGYTGCVEALAPGILWGLRLREVLGWGCHLHAPSWATLSPLWKSPWDTPGEAEEGPMGWVPP